MDNYKLVVLNVPISADYITLTKLFAKYAAIVKASFLKRVGGERGSRIGVVEIRSYNKSCKCVAALSGYHWDDYVLEVRLDKSSSYRIPSPIEGYCKAYAGVYSLITLVNVGQEFEQGLLLRGEGEPKYAAAEELKKDLTTIVNLISFTFLDLKLQGNVDMDWAERLLIWVYFVKCIQS